MYEYSLVNSKLTVILLSPMKRQMSFQGECLLKHFSTNTAMLFDQIGNFGDRLSRNDAQLCHVVGLGWLEIFEILQNILKISQSHFGLIQSMSFGLIQQFLTFVDFASLVSHQSLYVENLWISWMTKTADFLQKWFTILKEVDFGHFCEWPFVCLQFLEFVENNRASVQCIDLAPHQLQGQRSAAAISKFEYFNGCHD